MKSKKIFNLLVLVIFTGCKIQEVTMETKLSVFNSDKLNKDFEELSLFNLEKEPDLLNIINSFKKSNANEKLEDLVIKEFLELQICSTEVEVQFQDYPNELQAVLDFYNSMTKENMEWFDQESLKTLKYTSIRFVLNYANDSEGIEHLKNQLNHCKNDDGYADMVMSSSNLNECIEKMK